MKLPTPLLDLFRPLRGDVRTALAFDPSTSSTGWALWLSGDLHHGQAHPDAVVDVVDRLLAPSRGPLQVLAVEAPYKVGGQRAKRENGKVVVDDEGEPVMVGSGQQWKVAEAAGFLRGSYARNALVAWQPLPTEWRSVLGLNKGVRGTRKRDDVNDAVWLWACTCVPRDRWPRHYTNEGKEKRHFDEANAIALLHAAISLVKTAVPQPSLLTPAKVNNTGKHVTVGTPSTSFACDSPDGQHHFRDTVLDEERCRFCGLIR